MFFMAGLGMIFDFIVFKREGKSYLSSGNLPKKLAGLFGFSVIVTTIMEVSGNLIGNFWFYPYYSFGQYISLIFFNFFTYSFLLLESYWAARSLLKIKIRPRIYGKRFSKLLENLARLFNYFWILALIAILVALRYQKYPPTLDGQINSKFGNKVPLTVFLAFAIFLWLFCEGKSFLKKGPTVLFDLIQGDYRNIAFALSASAVTSIVFEYYNLFFSFWVYDNVPFANVKFLSIPLAVFLAWPLQYLVLIPLYGLVDGKVKHGKS